MAEDNKRGDDEMKIEFIATLKLILKLLELDKIEEAKEVIKDIIQGE